MCHERLNCSDHRRWRKLARRRDGHVGGTAQMHMAPIPGRPHHHAAACTDATAHPRRGHHRTTSYTSCSVRSPGRCRPHSLARRLDTTAPGPRSRLPFLPHASCRHSTRVGRACRKIEGTSPVRTWPHRPRRASHSSDPNISFYRSGKPRTRIARGLNSA
jgi:hypothetical protein